MNDDCLHVISVLWDKGIAFVTAAAVIAAAIIYWRQLVRMTEAVQGAKEQSEALERHIGETARQANAMIRLATAAEDNGTVARQMLEVNRTRLAAQMRAYVYVDVGHAVAQDRANNVKFEARPLTINGGHTPAKFVTTSYSTAVLPYPLPQGFIFPAATGATVPSTLGPHQSSAISGIADWADDNQVANIKGCIGNGLYIWGQVRYRDVLQDDLEPDRHTNFCRCYFWKTPQQVVGIMLGDNEAT